MPESSFLPEDIENHDAGHAGIHNQVNDQVNWLTEQVSPGGRLSPEGVAEQFSGAFVSAVVAPDGEITLYQNGVEL